MTAQELQTAAQFLAAAMCTPGQIVADPNTRFGLNRIALLLAEAGDWVEAGGANTTARTATLTNGVS